MPALPNVPNTLRVTMKQTLGDDIDVINRFFLHFDGTASGTDLDTYAATIGAQWHTHVQPQQTSQLNLVEVEVVDLTSTTGAIGIDTTVRAGTSGGTLAPAGACVLAQFKVARRYRGGHPRMYLAAPPAGELGNAQEWHPAYTAGVQSGVAAFFAAIISGAPAALSTILHNNVSYYEGFHNVTLPSGRETSRPTVRVTPLEDIVIGYSVNPKVASQRRRNTQ